MEEFNAYAEESKPKDKIESYKDRYGKVYLVSISINPDDNTTVDMNFCFKKPPGGSRGALSAGKLFWPLFFDQNRLEDDDP